MFEFRKEQYDGFSSVTRGNFEERLLERLEETNPECFVLLGDDEVARIVTESIDLAFSYEIRLECNVEQFVRLQLEEGQNFENQKHCHHIRRLLADDDVDETSKLKQLWILVETLAEPTAQPAPTDSQVESESTDVDPEDSDLDLTEDTEDFDDSHDFDIEDEFDFEDLPDEWED